MPSYLDWFMAQTKVVTYRGMSMWNLVTLSMPNRPIEPQGKVMASATPRSSMSRASGAEDCTLVPPSCVTIWPTVLVPGRIFMPLTSLGSTIFLVE